MSLILLVHAGMPRQEAGERAAALRVAGHEVLVIATPAGDGLRALLDEPLEAAVIDLRRVPSQGRGYGRLPARARRRRAGCRWGT